MRRQLTLTLTIILLITRIISIQAQGLKQSVKKFTKTMTQIQTTQTDFMDKLESLIDPSANVDSLCLDYYQHWKYNVDNNSYPLKTEIESIEKNPKDSATVRISNIWHMPTGEKYYFLSVTTWVKKYKKWYRTSQPAKILEKRKIDK